MPSSRPKARFEDIILYIERIMFYVDDHDQESFTKDIRTVDAVERCIERMTEASIKLQPLASELFPQQNWKAMRDMGNVLRHEYDSIDSTEIWRIVLDCLPSLLKDCRSAVAMIEEQEVGKDV